MKAIISKLTLAKVFYRLLSEKQQLPVLLLCILLFFTATGFVGWYWVCSNRYAKIIDQTLQVDLENTPQKFKGLEAFILSYISPDSTTSLQGGHFAPEFRSSYSVFSSRIRDASTTLREALSNSRDKKSLPSLAPHELRAIAQNSEILTDSGKDGTLFLPLDALHSNLTAVERFQVLQGGKSILVGGQSTANSVGAQDVSIQAELQLIDEVSSSLRDLTDIQIYTPQGTRSQDKLQLKLKPDRVFIITRTGIIRIFTKNNNYLVQRIPPHTSFPGRPYFWPAFDQNKSAFLSKNKPFQDELGPEVKDSFFVSRPYMDIGGSGVVVTLTRAFEIEGVTEAVIGFDIPFNDKNNLSAQLAFKIPQLSGQIIEIGCSRSLSGDCYPIQSRQNQARTVQPTHTQNELIADWNREWACNLDSTKTPDECRSGLLANIRKLTRFSQKSNLSEIRFSLPLGFSSDQGASQDEVRLLLATLDIGGYTATTTRIAVMAAVLFLSVMIIVTYLWGSNLRLLRQYEILSRLDADVDPSHIRVFTSFEPPPKGGQRSAGTTHRIAMDQDGERAQLTGVYIAYALLGLSAHMVLFGVILFYGTAFGLGMTFGAALVGYESYQFLREWNRQAAARQDPGRDFADVVTASYQAIMRYSPERYSIFGFQRGGSDVLFRTKDEAEHTCGRLQELETKEKAIIEKRKHMAG